MRAYDSDGALLIDPPTTRRPSLVVFVLEGVRADAVHGDMWLAADGDVSSAALRCENAAAPSPRAVPSWVSLLTGLLPSAHGCDAPGRHASMPAAVTTYPEALAKGFGYETVALTTGRWPPGFDTVLQGFETIIDGRDRAIAELGEWLAGRDATRPYLLVLRIDAANGTYDARRLQPDRSLPRPAVPDTLPTDRELAAIDALDLAQRDSYRSRFGYRYERAVRRYRFEGFARAPDAPLSKRLRDAYDRQVGRVDDLARAMHGLLFTDGGDDTFFVVTSSNGQAFGERGTLGEGLGLRDEHIHVPLVVLAPRVLPRARWRGSVGVIDVFPTLFDCAGFTPLQGVHGRSFREDALRSGDGRPVFSEERLGRDNTGVDVMRILTSVRSTRFKYVITFDRLAGTVLESTFDLDADPEERLDLAKQGRIEGLVFDAAFCDAVEAARDRIWGAAEGVKRREHTPYGAGEAQVTSKRPASCAPTR